MGNKTSYQAFMDRFEKLPTAHLIKEPYEQIASDLLQSLLDQIAKRTGGLVPELESNEYHLYDALVQADDFLNEAQTYRGDIEFNKIAVSFFQLGATLGRLQAFEYQASSIDEVAKHDAVLSNAGRNSQYYEYEDIIVEEIAFYENNKKQTQPKAIQKIELRIELKINKSTFNNWLKKFRANGGKYIF